MSAASELFYGMGLREGAWGIEAVDYGTGESVAWLPARNEPCTDEALSGVEPAQRTALDAVTERLPNSCENSVYAATEVGPGGSIYSGTLFGATSHVPTDPLPAPTLESSTSEEPDGVNRAENAASESDESESLESEAVVILIAVSALALFGGLVLRRRRSG